MFQSFIKKSYEDLNGMTFKQNFQNTSNAVLLDVRTPSEFNSQNIPGAINIDIMSYEFHDKVAELDKSKTYFIYCRSGNRSGQACHMMSELGFNTYNLVGGIGAWPF